MTDRQLTASAPLLPTVRNVGQSHHWAGRAMLQKIAKWPEYSTTTLPFSVVEVLGGTEIRGFDWIRQSEDGQSCPIRLHCVLRRCAATGDVASILHHQRNTGLWIKRRGAHIAY